MRNHLEWAFICLLDLPIQDCTCQSMIATFPGKDFFDGTFQLFTTDTIRLATQDERIYTDLPSHHAHGNGERNITL